MQKQCRILVVTIVLEYKLLTHHWILIDSAVVIMSVMKLYFAVCWME